MGRAYRRLVALLAVAAAAVVGEAGAQTRSLTVYGGRYTDASLPDEILRNHDIEFEDAWIAVVALARTISRQERHWQWEVEGQVTRYFGRQHTWELNSALVLRWKWFPWNRWLVTSAAIGDGLSLASTIPPLERASHTNHGVSRLLNYLVLEVSFAPPQRPDWAVVARIHHRSGIFGVFHGVRGGSNVICAGVKHRF